MVVLLKKPLLSLVLQGCKRSTIRWWKRCALAPGDVLRLNYRTPVTVTRVRQLPLSQLTTAEAQRDGFKSRSELMRVAADMGFDVRPDVLVWVIDFDPPKLSDQSIRASIATGQGSPT